MLPPLIPENWGSRNVLAVLRHSRNQCRQRQSLFSIKPQVLGIPVVIKEQRQRGPSISLHDVQTSTVNPQTSAEGPGWPRMCLGPRRSQHKYLGLAPGNSARSRQNVLAKTCESVDRGRLCHASACTGLPALGYVVRVSG
jgi:hypothetical protein